KIAADLFARALIGLGRRIGEIMQAAMDVRVFGRIGALDAVKHSLRLLRRSGIVEIDQRLAIDLRGQDGEILAHTGNVVYPLGDGRVHDVHGRSASQLSVAAISASRTPSCATVSIASPTKD